MLVRRRVVLNAPPSEVWAWLSRLDRLASLNLFHTRVRFETDQQSGLGTGLWLRHGLKGLPFGMERHARVTHWQAQTAIGWVEIDPAGPRSRFPHSQRFLLEALPDPRQTALTNELRGSLNLPFGRWTSPLDRAFGRYWVSLILALECRTLQNHFRNKRQSL